MKSKYLILTLISSLFLISCGSDDSCICIEMHAINGSWNLTNVNGGLIGINIDYNLGDVKWTFNESSGQLTVENNILTDGPESIYAGLDSGIYNYEIQEIEDTEMLLIEDDERGLIHILDNTLTLDDDVALDGFFTVFERE